MGKGENGSFLLLRKAHENPKVFVRAPTIVGASEILSRSTKNTDLWMVGVFVYASLDN